MYRAWCCERGTRPGDTLGPQGQAVLSSGITLSYWGSFLEEMKPEERGRDLLILLLSLWLLKLCASLTLVKININFIYLFFFTRNQWFKRRGFSFQDIFFFFPFIFISWRLITSQHFSGFCHTLTWISHGFTCIPHPDPPSHLPLHPIPLGLPSAPGPEHLSHASHLDWWSVSL